MLTRLIKKPCSQFKDCMFHIRKKIALYTNNRRFHSPIQFTLPLDRRCEQSPTSNHIKPTYLTWDNRYPHNRSHNQLNSPGRIRAPHTGHEWLALEIDNVGIHDECWEYYLMKPGILDECGTERRESPMKWEAKALEWAKGIRFPCRAPSDSHHCGLSHWKLKPCQSQPALLLTCMLMFLVRISSHSPSWLGLKLAFLALTHMGTRTRAIWAGSHAFNAFYNYVPFI